MTRLEPLTHIHTRTLKSLHLTPTLKHKIHLRIGIEAEKALGMIKLLAILSDHPYTVTLAKHMLI